jgi:hypothetical protein
MYPAPKIAMPVESLNLDKVSATVREIVPANTTDHTTAGELRTQLNSLQESRDFHSERADRYAQELAIAEGKLRNTKSALDEAEKFVVTRPVLRHRIAELEILKEKQKAEVSSLAVAVERHSNIRDSQVKLIKAFPLKKLRALEEEEELLGEGTGRKPFPARLPSE